MSDPYDRHVEYRFEVDGEEIALTIEVDGICVEEVRKNGQEDCHMEGVLVGCDGALVWEEGESSFIRYGSQELADGIRQYVSKHGLPTVD